jgi:hypothetical protein
VTRKRKMQARASAERAGMQAASREIRSVYWLVYRARGYTGPCPVPTLWSRGLIDLSTLPVVGR